MSRKDKDDSSDQMRTVNAMRPEDFQHQLEQYQHQSQQALGNALSVKSDGKGKYYWLGFEVPGEMVLVLNQLLINIRPHLNRKGTEFFYNKTAEIVERLKHGSNAAHKAGLGAAAAFSAVLVGAEPVVELVRLWRKNTNDKAELYKDISPVLSRNVNYRHNEVINTELNRIHGDFMSGLKQLSTVIPYMVPTVMSAMRDYAILKQDLGERVTPEGCVEKDIDKMVAAHVQDVTHRAEMSRRVQEKLREQQSKIFNTHFRGKINPSTRREYTTDDWEFRRVWADAEHEVKEAAINTEKSRSKQENPENKKLESFDKDPQYQYWITGTGLISGMLQYRMRKNEDSREQHLNTYQMIQHLCKEVSEQCGGFRGDSDTCARMADEIMISDPSGEYGGRRVSIQTYITDIFRRNEMEHGRGGIEGNLLKDLQPAVDIIARRIVGGLDPLTLIDLVGEHKIVKFKPNTKGERVISNEKETEEAIGIMAVNINAQEGVSLKEFCAKYADPVLAEETLKKTMSQLQGLDKAMFASIFSNEQLKESGLKDKEISALRDQAREHFSSFMMASAEAISKMDVESLKKLGMPEEEIAAVASFMESVARGDKEAVEAAATGNDKLLMSAVRTELLGEQMVGNTSWTERVRDMGNTKRKLEATIKQAVEEGMGPREGFAEREVIPASHVARQEIQPDERGVVPPGGMSW